MHGTMWIPLLLGFGGFQRYVNMFVVSSFIIVIILVINLRKSSLAHWLPPI